MSSNTVIASIRAVESKRARRTTVLVFALVVWFQGHGAPTAAAQPADSMAAEQLFSEGRSLMDKKDYAAACAKFEASLALEPLAGTMVNLAACYEQMGKLASAWLRYRETAELDQHGGNAERERFARAQAKALEARLPRLLIQVSTPDAPELVITRDGLPVERALWGVAVYVDPGDHQIVATAPGYQAFSTTATAREGEKTVLDIPSLTPEPATPEPATPEPATPEPRGPIVAAKSHESPTGGLGSRRILGLVVGGGGLASLATGLVLGRSAMSSWDGAFDTECNRASLICTPDGQEMTDRARHQATVSTALVGTGVALVSVGVVLYLTAPKRRRARTLTLLPGEKSMGLSLSGQF